MISTPDRTSGADGLWDRFTAPTEHVRRPFRRWRRGRPFYAGLSVALAGLDIWYWPHSSVGKMLSMGLPGISSLFIAIFLLVFAVTIWFFPTYRVFSGIASIMLALLSLVATNLGGFFLGFLLGMLGGAFAIAWTPRDDYTVDTRRQRRKRLAEVEYTAGESAETVAVPAQAAQPEAEHELAEHEFAADDRESAPEYTENTQIIEQAARSDEAASAGAEPFTEQE
ncbi:MAG TPA: DUF6114 domain-containing protein [Actinospica sp.]|jgi:hypothetical protein|nr:DUF6114 domain-containing protein [Actinospica sp.]